MTKRILFTGGGTAGHVTPNMALIPKLVDLGFEVHYAGQQAGIERRLIETLNIPYHPVPAGKLRRYFDLKNLRDVFLVGLAFFKSLRIMRHIRPDIVFSKGGFVSCPVVWAAWTQRIPTIIHESDLTPGLANTLSVPFASQICYSFPETSARLPRAKSILTGIPIREALLHGEKTEGLKLCGFTNAKPALLVIGGSQGSETINHNIRQALKKLCRDFQVCHICGNGNVQPDLSALPEYAQFEYVHDELPHLFAMADIVVSRAGATTLFELSALCKPHLLIPLSRKVSRGDQVLNAQSFEQQGFSRVLSEDLLTPISLVAEIQRTYSQRGELQRAMRHAEITNAVDNVLAVILSAMRK